MPFYVERTDFIPMLRNGRRVSLIDTDDLNTNFSLEERFLVAENEQRSQSMMTIEYKSPPWKSLIEGNWYDIERMNLKQFEYLPVNQEMQGGAFLRARLIGPPEKIDFTSFLTNESNATPFKNLPSHVNQEPTNTRLIIVDCGQGNWNEILSDQDRVIYDIGASNQYKFSELKTLVQSRNLATETRPIHIILSHWDVDHYQGLLGCTPADLSNIRMLITPSPVPNTSTYKRVINLLTTNGVTISSIPPATRPIGIRNRIVLCFHLQKGPYKFFRAVPGRSRNQTGIVVSFDGPNRTAILTGDHHYEKVIEAIRGRHTNIDGILVTPHHGGMAGCIDVNKWTKEFPTLDTPISVGKNNPYRHPLSSVITALTCLQGIRPPSETCMCGDLTYNL